MQNTHLEDAEALRLLLEDTALLAHDAHRLLELVSGLSHTVHRVAAACVQGQPVDPRQMLTEIGAVVERCHSVELGRVGLEDALGSLRVAFVPNPTPLEGIQAKELVALRARLVRGGHPVRARRPRPTPS